MEQVLINNANAVSQTIPAGVALRDISGAVGVSLTAGEAQADIVVLSGTITAAVLVTVPAPPVPTQMIGTTGTSGGLSSGWWKIFRNNVVGAFAVTVSGSSGAGGVTVPINTSMVIWSPDGVTAYSGGVAV